MRGRAFKTYRRAWFGHEEWILAVEIVLVASFAMLFNFLCVWLLLGVLT